MSILPRLREFASFITLSWLVIASCTSGAARDPTPHPVTPGLDPTPFRPQLPTGTPEGIGLWLSPRLPLELSDRVRARVAEAPVSFHLSDSRASAMLALEPGGEVTLSLVIFAVAAPFPSLRDQVGVDEVEGRWTGEGEGMLLLTEATQQVWESRWGEPNVDTVQVVPPEELLERAWSDPDSLALVPFEDLAPRWKVLSIEGQNPLHRAFEADSYPLTMEFGLSGGTNEQRQDVARRLDLPPTNRDPRKLTTLVMTGVTALVRTTAWRMEVEGVFYPGEKVEPWLTDADLLHVSHEAAFAPDCPTPEPYTYSTRFCSPPSSIELFTNLGVDLVELTGNHLKDWGTDALLYSLGLYSDRGMATFGGGLDAADARQPVLVEHNGNKLAFLGCNAAGPEIVWATESSPGAANCEGEWWKEGLAGLVDEGYLPVFTFQWPESMNPRPLPPQVEGFRSAVEAGAVIVNGSQAHRPQTLEFYGGGFIHYGLGNLFFDQMQSLPLRQEFIDRHVFYEGRYISTELFTAILEDFAQPRPMTPDERRSFLEEIFSASGW